MATLGERFLESNPRRIKRLLNTYRYIKLLASTAREPVQDAYWQGEMIAWLVFTMRWPAMMEDAIEQARKPREDSGDDKVYLKSFFADLPDDDLKPTDQDIEQWLPIDRRRTRELAVLASNFLIEYTEVDQKNREEVRPGPALHMSASNNGVSAMPTVASKAA